MAAPSTFIICTRQIKGKSFTSEPGDTTFLKVPASASNYTPANAISRATWRRQLATMADVGADPVTKMSGDVLVFVHGYNNDQETVLWRSRELQRTLRAVGWRGVVIAFDWPSANSTLNYLEDRADASGTSLRLVQESLDLLIEAQNPTDPSVAPCKLNIHLLGHSTGAFVIMEAFAQAQRRGDMYKTAWRIAQVAFIGGDVARDSLRTGSDWNQPMFDRIMRFTNYSNRFDKVLGVSNAKRLGTSPRAGRVGLPSEIPAKAVNVDCSSYFATKDPQTSSFRGTFNHSWHIGDEVFALDLAMTLEGGVDREAIPTRRRLPDRSLELQAGRRPDHQALWDAEAPTEVSA